MKKGKNKSCFQKSKSPTPTFPFPFDDLPDLEEPIQPPPKPKKPKWQRKPFKLPKPPSTHSRESSPNHKHWEFPPTCPRTPNSPPMKRPGPDAEVYDWWLYLRDQCDYDNSKTDRILFSVPECPECLKRQTTIMKQRLLKTYYSIDKSKTTEKPNYNFIL